MYLQFEGEYVRKYLSLATLLIFCLLTCCKGKPYSFYIPDGTPLLCTAKMCVDNSKSSYDIRYNRVSGTELISKMLSETADIVIAPLISLVNMHNSNHFYTLLGIVTFDNNFLVAKESFNHEGSLVDNLYGEIIISYQRNNVSGLLMNVMLKNENVNIINTISDKRPDMINILYVANASDVTPIFRINNEIKFAVMPEPATSLMKILGFDVISSLSSLIGESAIPQAGLAVKKKLLDNNRNLAAFLLAKLRESTDYLFSNPDEVIDICINKLQSPSLSNEAALKLFISERGSSILVVKSSEEVRDSISLLLGYCLEINSSLIGDKLPSEDFYFS